MTTLSCKKFKRILTLKRGLQKNIKCTNNGRLEG